MLIRAKAPKYCIRAYEYKIIITHSARNCKSKGAGVVKPKVFDQAFFKRLARFQRRAAFGRAPQSAKFPKRRRSARGELKKAPRRGVFSRGDALKERASPLNSRLRQQSRTLTSDFRLFNPLLRQELRALNFLACARKSGRPPTRVSPRENNSPDCFRSPSCVSLRRGVSQPAGCDEGLCPSTPQAF